MISHSNKFIFIHIPKTGGTSIEYLLREHGILLQGNGNFDSLYYKHATARAIKRMMGDEYDTYFKFAFVRNPWDWLVSVYSFCRGFTYPYIAGTSYSISAKVKPEHRNWPFCEWLPWWVEKFSPSQAMMLVDEEGQLLVDFIGRFECLTTDLEHVCDVQKLPFEPLPHLKRSDRGLFHEYFDTTTTKFVIENFRTDFELFGYPMELEGPGNIPSP